MRLIPSLAAAAAVLLHVLPVLADTSDLRAFTEIGCFSSSGTLVDQGQYQFQSRGYCQGVCGNAGFTVMALSKGSDCWCGNEVPTQKASNVSCSSSCYGYGPQTCGGPNAWWVAYTGTTVSTSSVKPSSSATATGPATVQTSISRKSMQVTP
jgi:cell wall integrity and stress response component